MGEWHAETKPTLFFRPRSNQKRSTTPHLDPTYPPALSIVIITVDLPATHVAVRHQRQQWTPRPPPRVAERAGGLGRRLRQPRGQVPREVSHPADWWRGDGVQGGKA